MAVAFGGLIRDGVGQLAVAGDLGRALATPAAGYSFVYHLEIGLLFLTLAALGPLVRTRSLNPKPEQGQTRIGLAEFPT